MNSENDTLKRAVELDRAGFLPGVAENETEFFARVAATLEAHKSFLEKLESERELLVFGEVRVSETDRIPAEITAEAEEVTRRLYDFGIEHVPGFFLSRDVGLLWGGCMISDPDEFLSIFLIRGAFRTRRKWLFYNRQELLAHELCHSMRQSLRDVPLEEFFAYQTSPSRLRRYLGNCFIREYDAVWFVIPALLLFGAQLTQSFWLPGLPVWPFWPLALAYPAFLLVRNALSRRLVFRAERRLAVFGIDNPGALLFRLTTPEIREIGGLTDRALFDRFVEERAAAELRWRVIRSRFIRKPQEEEEDHETDPSGELS